MVAVTQDKQQYNQENDPAGNLTEKMRYRRVSFLFEIKIPDVPIYQSDYQCRAQQDRCCANMVSPGGVDTINGNGGVERQYQAEKPKQQAKAYSGTAL